MNVKQVKIFDTPGAFNSWSIQNVKEIDILHVHFSNNGSISVYYDLKYYGKATN